METVVVIPARGQSKGIPRKNLAQLRGKPLIAWVIEAALAASRVSSVVVSTDSEEIALAARRAGATVLMRHPDLAGDAVTLDPVIDDAVRQLEAQGATLDLVLTVQPTSPLLRPQTIDRIIERMSADPSIDSIITAVDATHLGWREEQGQPVPDYTARVNRQVLPRRYKETGGVLATRRRHVTATGRIGRRVALEILPATEGLDIDTSEEWLFAEAALGRRRIAFRVLGNRTQGSGHAMRVMTLLQQLVGHVTRTFCTPAQDLAIELLRGAFYPVEVVQPEDMLRAIETFGADIVVHDELDTDAELVRAERDRGMRVVCFEDLGSGGAEADLLFNALYDAGATAPEQGRYFGPDWYVIRDEFLSCPRPEFRAEVRRVLITFGGTDPSGLTLKVLDAVAPTCPVPLVVVAGRGYAPSEELEAACERHRQTGATVELHSAVSTMSDMMARADIAFSSAGRTVYELAHLLVPTIVLAQNAQELHHSFASPRWGCLNLGLGADVPPAVIQSTFRSLLESRPLRQGLRQAMQSVDLTRGRQAVVRHILELE